MEIEIWKDIEGFEGRYQVSTLGRVKSLARTRLSKAGSISQKKEIILKPGRDKDGYLRVVLVNGDNKRYATVSRLVAEAFIDNPYNLPQVRHDPDDTVTNNKVTNLKWGTDKQNKDDMFSRGRENKAKGEDTGNVKLTEDIVIKIAEYARLGLENKEIIKLIGDPSLNTKDIWNVKSGKNWSWLTGIKRKQK